MIESTIIQKIAEKAQTLKEQDLDEWVVPELTKYYHPKLRSLAAYAYGASANSDGASVALQAFIARAKAEIRKGTHTFYFVSEHWRNNRDLNSYLLTCLNRLANRIKSDADSVKKTTVPICPACKIYNEKSYLKYEGKLLRCHTCFSEISRLEDLSQSAAIESELRLRKIFTLHSRAGSRCPECERFIPESYFQSYGTSCPYDDCFWFGSKDGIEPMIHPLGLGSDNLLSLNLPVASGAFTGSRKAEWQDLLKSNDSAEARIEVSETYKNELLILNEVVDTQFNRIKRNNNGDKTFIQKLLMYQAYKNLIDKYPDDMISYLVYLKHSGTESPIQSRIFQEYIRLIENALPIMHRGQEICSLLDPNLGLFLGVSEFNATVRGDGIIPNNTIETYTGGRKLKFFGPCFIGMLIDVVDRDSGKSIRNSVKNYTFVQIRMSGDITPGTPVKVTHFRIPSHYEMGGLVYLQRIRRKIVDSVYFRINGVKRKIRSNEKE
jgi:hypothetical protein